MVASENYEFIEGRLWLISVDVTYSEEVAEDVYIDYDGSDLDEEDECGLRDASVRTCVTQ